MSDDAITVEFGVPATMRDGTILRANIYRPAGEGRWPVLLTRLPYGKDLWLSTWIFDPAQVARRGYVVIVQDTRGRGSSDGTFYPFRDEGPDGIIRARYRDFGRGAPPSLIEPGRPCEYAIDLWATSNLFRAGHRPRVQITSSCFPRWDRNPNTGHPFGADAELQVAYQEVLCDRAHPSRIVLPIVHAELEATPYEQV